MHYAFHYFEILMLPHPPLNSKFNSSQSLAGDDKQRYHQSSIIFFSCNFSSSSLMTFCRHMAWRGVRLIASIKGTCYGRLKIGLN
jgi:hypothetical protein